MMQSKIQIPSFTMINKINR